MADKGDSKPRGRGKGGDKREGKGGARGKGDGGKGKGDRPPRKPREELPMVEDPKAELDKLMAEGEPPKPNRDALERQVGAIQHEIDSSKLRTDAITKELDGIKEKNEKIKQQGSGELQGIRDKLGATKKQIVGVIEQRKQISLQIDGIRAKKTEQDEAIKKQKAGIGRFNSNEAIDAEIARIEEQMQHTTLSIKQEKDYILTIKELNKKRDEVKQLEIMEGKRGAGGKSMSLTELFDKRKELDEVINGLRTTEKALGEKLGALREKSQNKESSERFERLLQERKDIREKIQANIQKIRDMRSAHQKLDDKWFNFDRLSRNLKWQLRQKQNKEREEREKERREKAAAEGVTLEDAEETGEDGEEEKPMDWDLAQRICQIEQLMVFLQGCLPKKEEEAAPAAPAAATQLEGAYQRGLDMEDSLGLMDFMVDEVVSKRKGKKDKKKKHNLAKITPTDGEAVSLQLSLDMMKVFTDIGLSVPTHSDDAVGSIAQLTEKKEYYEKEGKEGLSLKDIIKKEKAARAEKTAKKPTKDEKVAKEIVASVEKAKEVKAAKEVKEEAKAAKAAEPKAEDAAAISHALVAKVLAKVTGGAKAEPASWDLGAAKLARKAAEMPDHGMSEADLAAMRAKAKGNQMTEAEKKERGLLYDTSKASAVRDDSDEEDDGAADMDGGFDWD